MSSTKDNTFMTIYIFKAPKEKNHPIERKSHPILATLAIKS